MVMLHVGVVLQEDLKLVDMTNPFFVASLKRGIQAFRCVCTVFRYCVVVAYDRVLSPLHRDCVATTVTTSESQLQAEGPRSCSTGRLRM